eukprot:g50099.t1
MSQDPKKGGIDLPGGFPRWNPFLGVPSMQFPVNPMMPQQANTAPGTGLRPEQMAMLQQQQQQFFLQQQLQMQQLQMMALQRQVQQSQQDSKAASHGAPPMIMPGFPGLPFQAPPFLDFASMAQPMPNLPATSMIQPMANLPATQPMANHPATAQLMPNLSAATEQVTSSASNLQSADRAFPSVAGQQSLHAPETGRSLSSQPQEVVVTSSLTLSLPFSKKEAKNTVGVRKTESTPMHENEGTDQGESFGFVFADGEDSPKGKPVREASDATKKSKHKQEPSEEESDEEDTFGDFAAGQDRSERQTQDSRNAKPLPPEASKAKPSRKASKRSQQAKRRQASSEEESDEEESFGGFAAGQEDEGKAPADSADRTKLQSRVEQDNDDFVPWQSGADAADQVKTQGRDASKELATTCLQVSREIPKELDDLLGPTQAEDEDLPSLPPLYQAPAQKIVPEQKQAPAQKQKRDSDDSEDDDFGTFETAAAASISETVAAKPALLAPQADKEDESESDESDFGEFETTEGKAQSTASVEKQQPAVQPLAKTEKKREDDVQDDDEDAFEPWASAGDSAVQPARGDEQDSKEDSQDMEETREEAPAPEPEPEPKRPEDLIGEFADLSAMPAKKAKNPFLAQQASEGGSDEEADEGEEEDTQEALRLSMEPRDSPAHLSVLSHVFDDLVGDAAEEVPLPSLPEMPSHDHSFEPLSSSEMVPSSLPAVAVPAELEEEASDSDTEYNKWNLPNEFPQDPLWDQSACAEADAKSYDEALEMLLKTERYDEARSCAVYLRQADELARVKKEYKAHVAAAENDDDDGETSLMLAMKAKKKIKQLSEAGALPNPGWQRRFPKECVFSVLLSHLHIEKVLTKFRPEAATAFLTRSPTDFFPPDSSPHTEALDRLETRISSAVRAKREANLALRLLIGLSGAEKKAVAVVWAPTIQLLQGYLEHGITFVSELQALSFDAGNSEMTIHLATALRPCQVFFAGVRRLLEVLSRLRVASKLFGFDKLDQLTAAGRKARRLQKFLAQSTIQPLKDEASPVLTFDRTAYERECTVDLDLANPVDWDFSSRPLCPFCLCFVSRQQGEWEIEDDLTFHKSCFKLFRESNSKRKVSFPMRDICVCSPTYACSLLLALLDQYNLI